MDNGLIPHRYAKALYKYSLEKGTTEEVYSIAKTVITSFEENPDLQKTLSNPFVKPDSKEKLLIAAAGDGADDAYRRFVKLIIKLHREDLALCMMLAYRDIYRRENRISQAKITTASELDASLMEKLEELVKSSFKDSTLEFSQSVDPSLIGGFVIDVDSVRMDASVSNEFEQLRQTLLRSN